MPLYDYHCTACQADFELLVRSDSPPRCPHCDSAALERAVSRIAPAGKIAGLRQSARRAAAAEGHFSHYSRAEKAKLAK